MRLRKLFKRTPTLTTDEVGRVLKEIAPNYQTNMVLFTTTSTDGIIRPKDKIDVYTLNNGHMGWVGFTRFTEEIENAIGREISCHHINSDIPISEIYALNATCVYNLLDGEVVNGRKNVYRLCFRILYCQRSHSYDA